MDANHKMSNTREPQVSDSNSNVQSFIQIKALSKEFNGFKAVDQINLDINTVSYTHLTLPTNREV